MTTREKSRNELLAENEELRRRLEEADELLQAIRSGEVDALVVSGADGEQVYTLQGAEHPYRVLVESMNEGAATLGPDGTIVYCNRRLAAMLQVPLEKLIGSRLESYVAPADYPLFLNRLEQCAIECDKKELSLATGSGNLIPALFSCCAVEPSESGGMSVVITDISTRKKAEETILRLNRLYAVSSATNHAIVQLKEPEAIFREFCRVAVELGGFRLAWVGRVEKETGVVEVVAASGETGYLEGLRVSVNEEPDGMGPTGISIREGTFYICNDLPSFDAPRPWRPNAHTHGLYASASIAIEQNHEVFGALTLYAGEKDFFDSQQVELLRQMGSDVSFALDTIHQAKLRRRAEQSLQEETVKGLRAAEELRQSERMLIQQSRLAALGEMIGNIAHQWRQPLNGLALLVQEAPALYPFGEVNQEYLDSNAKKSMELIQHMSQTIDDFRNFFKPEKEKVDFSVHKKVMQTLSLMEGSLDSQRIDITVDVKNDPIIHGYPNEYSQVLLNILTNARDALVEKGTQNPMIVITISSHNDRAVVTIADNAGGIPEDIMDKIFDPYFTTKGAQTGTGVGLFMAKNIIEKNMGGWLTVRNTGDGAEFTIEV